MRRYNGRCVRSDSLPTATRASATEVAAAAGRKTTAEATATATTEAAAGEELHEEDLDDGHDWARGFFTAVAMREAEWDQWLDENEWIEEIFEMLSQLAGGPALESDDPSGSAEPIGYKERLSIVVSIPGMLADLNQHRIEQMTPREPIRREATPGRNDPCTCGSGKKYKKCCGVN